MFSFKQLYEDIYVAHKTSETYHTLQGSNLHSTGDLRKDGTIKKEEGCLKCI